MRIWSTARTLARTCPQFPTNFADGNIVGPMIFQIRNGKVLAIAQPDHARFAGAMAEAWGGSVLVPEPWHPVVVATARHDDGWSKWEEEPTLKPDGSPHDFISISMDERIDIFNRCVDLVNDDIYAAALVSMHVIGLFLGRMEPNRRKMIDGLQGEPRKQADQFISSQHAWQKKAMEGLDVRNLMLQYRLLEAYDRVSLALCMQPISNFTTLVFDYVPLRAGNPVDKLNLEISGDRIILDPYPFKEDDLELSVPARLIGDQQFESVEIYRKTLSDAPVEELRFTFGRR